jgi:hypothetical protein
MHRLKEVGASHALVFEHDAPTSFLNKKIIIQLKKIIIPLMNVTPNIAMIYIYIYIKKIADILFLEECLI